MTSEIRKFKGEDVPAAVFYPTGYVLAVFDGIETAQQARDGLTQAGFAEDDVIVLQPDEVLAQYREYTHDRDGSLVEKAKDLLSNMGDDSRFVEQYVDLARKGFVFVFVRATETEETERITRVIEPLRPERARKYDNLTVTDLIAKAGGL